MPAKLPGRGGKGGSSHLPEGCLPGLVRSGPAAPPSRGRARLTAWPGGYSGWPGSHQREGTGEISTYRLFPGTDGPSSAVSYGGPFLAGVQFEVTTGGMWFEGYWWWVCPSGQPTSPQKFALWNVTGQQSAVLIPGSVITSGALAAGKWNWLPLVTPLPLAVGTCYSACTGLTGSFPVTNDQFGSGDPYARGLTNGPLTAYSDTGGSLPTPYTTPQGIFGVASADPSASRPADGSNSANFWIDLQVSDSAPAGYSGSYRLWPNKHDAAPETTPDSAVNYVVATEIHLSQSSALNNIWYYSPAGVSQLATECGVWDMSTRKLVAQDASPSWSGPAASGWISCGFTGVVLPAGKYKVAVYNGAAVPDPWSAKQLRYWDVGPGQNGIANGPLQAPQLADASPASLYQASGQEPGQCTFAVGPPNQYPGLYVNGLAQNYWVDIEVTPAAGGSLPAGPSPADAGAFLAFFP